MIPRPVRLVRVPRSLRFGRRLSVIPTASGIRLVNLPNVNQNRCENKTFALTYTGTATN